MYTSPAGAPAPGALYSRATQTSNGKIYATFEQYTTGVSSFQIFESTNNGETWTKVGDVKDTHKGVGMRWEPFFMVVNNKLICYYSDERDNTHSQKLVHQTTADGINWSSVVNDVALADSSQRPGMSVVAKRPDGNYIMTYEIVGKTGGVYYKISSNPESWNPSDAGICFDPAGSGSNNQKWIRETSGNYYKFKNAATGLYLDGMGASVKGSSLCQWAGSTSNNQLWSIMTP